MWIHKKKEVRGVGRNILWTTPLDLHIIGNLQLTIVCFMTIWNYNLDKVTYDLTLLCPEGHMIPIQVLGNWFAFMTDCCMSCDCDLLPFCQFMAKNHPLEKLDLFNDHGLLYNFHKIVVKLGPTWLMTATPTTEIPFPIVLISWGLSL